MIYFDNFTKKQEKVIKFCVNLFCENNDMDMRDIYIYFSKIEFSYGYTSKSISLDNTFNIYINTDLNFDLFLDVIFHELTHVKQLFDEKLKTIGGKMYWKNELFMDYNEYSEISGSLKAYKLPWELEASETAKCCVNIFSKNENLKKYNELFMDYNLY